MLAAGRSSNNPVNAAYRAGLAKIGEPTQNISLRFVGDSQVALLKIRSFVGDGFLAALDSTMRLAVGRRPAAMILDLRGNGGGNKCCGDGVTDHDEPPNCIVNIIHGIPPAASPAR